MISSPETVHPDSSALARYIDHTLLKPEATASDVRLLIEEAVRLNTYSVCVSPSMLPLSIPVDSDLKIAVVCGFPSGKHSSEIKAAEARLALSQGAHEIDMVIDIGAAKGKQFDAIRSDIAAVRAAVPAPAILKVIIESAALSDDEIIGVCTAASEAKADFVKTSTGFHPAGGATVHAVSIMSATVGDRLGVKASGGIRTYEQAVAMVAAGATRLGVSGSAEVLNVQASNDSASGY